MTMIAIRNTRALVMGLILFGTVGTAIRGSDDPAFDRYLDLEILDRAWGDKNASLLADVGLELAEGERVLFRGHKNISADQVLAMATRVAAERRDAKTLSRLAKACEAYKKTELGAQANGALRLA